MLTSRKQVPQFKSLFSAYVLHEIILQGADSSDVDSELDDLIEISEESVEIDEIQIGKLYLCL
jgi:hypothetical protein